MKKLLALFLSLVMVAGVCFGAEFTKIRAKHILVDNYAQALQIKRDIETTGKFDYYAQIYSKCPSGRNGGDLGYFGRGQMVKEFEDAAFNAEPGKVIGPIQTQFGWHLIMVTDKT